MSTWKITDRVISGLDASKLSGALPAVDASALTNLPGITKSASDPAIDTNPSGGVGTLWANTTSGELFACSDATTDENVWTNIGSGSGDIKVWGFQATISGYNVGGYTGAPSPSTQVDEISKWSLVSNGNATDVGNLVAVNHTQSGSSSSTHGYVAGGFSTQTRISKFTFVTDGNAVDVANLTQAKYGTGGNSSETNGYCTSSSAAPQYDVIEKYNFATDSDGQDIANLTVGRTGTAGQNSETHGYNSGGGGNGNFRNIIDKYTFATDNDATDVGDLTFTRHHPEGQSSETHGYTSGGQSNLSNVIDRFPFASDTNATDVGDLTITGAPSANASSSTHGYNAGGYTPSIVNVINKFQFAASANATDVGDLLGVRGAGSSAQY